MNMVDEIGSKENIESWLDKALSERRKVMGMGHRVYKAKDPRATVMEQFLEQLSEARGDRSLYEFLKQLEKSFGVRMSQKGKPVYPNVDFFSGAVYTILGIPRYLFTPIFAAARRYRHSYKETKILSWWCCVCGFKYMGNRFWHCVLDI